MRGENWIRSKLKPVWDKIAFTATNQYIGQKPSAANPLDILFNCKNHIFVDSATIPYEIIYGGFSSDQKCSGNEEEK